MPAAGGQAAARSLYNRAVESAARGDPERAVRLYGQALRHHPGMVEAHCNLGALLHDRGELEAAIRHYRQALRLLPDQPDITLNLGCALRTAGRLEEAERLFRELAGRHPGEARAHLNLAMLLLLQGRWREGWAEYEWRWALPGAASGRHGLEEWDGSPRPEATLRLFAEQGFGDTLQFLRYLPEAARRVGRVVVETLPGLEALVPPVPGSPVQVVTRGEPLPPAQIQAPLMSLPHRLGLHDPAAAPSPPYLAVPPDRVERWRERLPAGAAKRVGLVWSGSPKPGIDPWSDPACPARELLTLATVPGITWISLQKSPDAVGVALLRERIGLRDPGGPLGDFADTAAVIRNLDLVITVDTAVAHLAGALGRPVWVLLPYSPDWRWGGEGERSAWYPQARLFRQTSPGDWAGVMERVVAALGRGWTSGDGTMAAVSAPAGDRFDRALAAHRAGETARAVRLYTELLEDHPAHEGAWANLALLGGDEAPAILRRAVRQCPGSPLLHHRLGGVLLERGESREAVEHLREAARLDPRNAAPLSDLAVALNRAGELEEALECADRALAMEPERVEALNVRGILLRRLGRPDEALGVFQRLSELDPENPRWLNNRAIALQAAGRLEEALRLFDRLAREAPDFAEGRWNRACALLLAGREEGWREYEWGFAAGYRRLPPLPGRPWREGEGVPAELLVVAEQGIGDTLQFCRLLPRLREAGCHVSLAVPSSLVRLLASSGVADRIVPLERAGDLRVERHLALLSLPARIGCDPPWEVPYLHIPAGEPLSLPEGEEVRIGLVWRGNPSHHDDRLRSIPAERLAPFAAVQGVRWFSLQPGSPDGLQWLRERIGIEAGGERLTDFAATAALCRQMDLIVTVDTAVAHLAGALGRPVWLLLPFAPDWRWGRTGESTPWYPTMRLFRQSAPGDWTGVVERVREALESWISRRHAPAKLAGAGEEEGALPEGDLARAHRLLAADRLDEAERIYRRLLAEDKGAVEARNGLGVLLRLKGDLRAAHACFEEVLARRPEHWRAHFNRAQLLLLERRWAEGWREYEWRLATRPDLFDGSPPLWDGSDPRGEVVRIEVEQGAGDTFQFVHLLGRLRRLGARVELLCPRQFHALMEASGVADRLLESEEESAARWRLPLMSLPLRLGLDPDRDWPSPPWLAARPSTVDRWRRRLAGDRPKIGLVWAGSAEHGEDRRRSAPPSALSTLREIEGICWHALQLPDRPPRPWAGLPSLAAHLTDWEETAGALSALDLLITVDTGVAHLAGALGRPVWLLLPWAAEWRWGEEGEVPLWYPTMRLFRQPAPGDWQGVVERVKRALGEWRDRLSERTTARDAGGGRLAGGGRPAREAPAPAEEIRRECRAGLERLRAGDGEGARRIFLRVVERAPSVAEGWRGVAMAAEACGDAPAAVSGWQNALSLEAREEDRLRLACALSAAGEREEAERELRELLALRPRFHPARLQLVRWLAERDARGEALELVERGLQEAPGTASLLAERGRLLLADGELEAAEASLREAMAAGAEEEAVLHVDLGIVLQHQGRETEAERQYRAALAIRPLPGAWTNLGTLALRRNDLREALACFERALSLDPEDADARFNRSLALLLGGELKRGWQEYEWRLRRACSGVIEPPGERWRGESLTGRRLLVYAEQGYGDTFQYCRFLRRVKALGGEVVFRCQPGLGPVLRGLEGVDELIDWAESPDRAIAYHFHLPLMSLPAVLGLDGDALPGEIPYLRADPQKVDVWRKRLAGEGMRVGLVWAGRPTHQNDRNRSMPLDALEPLGRLEGVRLFSLQKGESVRQLRDSPWARQRVEDLGTSLECFSETAALLEALDLVITVDTAVAHLAGALGRPCWLLLPHAPDWRWQLQREDSPWYPTLRLFRQGRPGDWEGVVRKVSRRLEEEISAGGR